MEQNDLRLAVLHDKEAFHLQKAFCANIFKDHTSEEREVMDTK